MATLSFGTPPGEWDKASFLLKEAQVVKEKASLKGQTAEEIRETLQQWALTKIPKLKKERKFFVNALGGPIGSGRDPLIEEEVLSWQHAIDMVSAFRIKNEYQLTPAQIANLEIARNDRIAREEQEKDARKFLREQIAVGGVIVGSVAAMMVLQIIYALIRG